jgi:ketopantoate reductase
METMNALVVGAGALGGVVTGRLLDAGAEVALATRDRASAHRILTTGIRITGVGGEVMVDVNRVAPLSGYTDPSFDLVLLATKAQAAIELAPKLIPCLHRAEPCWRSRTVSFLYFSPTRLERNMSWEAFRISAPP